LDKKERFKEKYIIIDNETGAEVNYEKFKTIDYSINREAKAKSFKANILQPENKELIKLNTKNERRWFKLFTISLTENDINYDLYGFLLLLARHVKTDGTCRVGDDHRKSYWAEKLKIPLPTFNRQFKKLQNRDIITHIRNKGIYINPYYLRYGNTIDHDILNIFKLALDKDNKLIMSDSPTTHS